MNVYQVTPKILTALTASNVTVSDAWTLIRSEFMDLPTYGNGQDPLTIKVDEVAENFNSSGIFTEVGGDNEPVENVNPEVIPVAVKGDHALWFDTNLDIAEKELEDYEYVIMKDGTNAVFYLIFGKLNVSKTDFYTPASEAKNAHYFRMDDDVSNY